uniref:hypothetical protein n=1 Tax=Candidatus Methylacidithermus pantelleriae TaxID=2744239 RepID=UPI001BD567CA
MGAQMDCNAILTVCKSCRGKKAWACIRKEPPVPTIRFAHTSMHFDKRTYTLKGERVLLSTIDGRIKFPLQGGEYPTRIPASGRPKEAEWVVRDRTWYRSPVVQRKDSHALASGSVLRVEVAQKNLAPISTGKIFGSGKLRDTRDYSLALRHRFPSNGSQSAREKLRQESDKKMRSVWHMNPKASKSVVGAAIEVAVARIRMQDLTHIPNRRKGRKRVCATVGTAGRGGSCHPSSTTSIPEPPCARPACVGEVWGHA